jgi:hypothetical protein
VLARTLVGFQGFRGQSVEFVSHQHPQGHETPFGVDCGHNVVVAWEKSLHLVLSRAGRVSRKDLWICSWDSNRESKRCSSSKI